MKQTRYTEAQIVEICRISGVSEQAFYRWKRRYGDMQVSEVRRLRGLEAEKARLKRLLAARDLEIALSATCSGEHDGAPEKRHPVRVPAATGVSTIGVCSLVGTSRSHLAYEAKPRDDAEFLAVIREIRRRKPRWGVRRTHRQLVRRGLLVNRKRVERVWRRHSLAVPGAGVDARSGPVRACRSQRRTEATSGPTTSSTTPSPRGAR